MSFELILDIVSTIASIVTVIGVWLMYKDRKNATDTEERKRRTHHGILCHK